MHSAHTPYFRFTSRSRLDKSINSLIGLVEGISIDRAINDSEVAFLNQWAAEHHTLRNLHPFNELIPVVQAAINDGVLSQDERDDILWLCERLRSTEYYNQTTADLQRLHGMVGGIIADGVVTEDELRGLASWLDDHDHLKTCWPYDEISSLITVVMADKFIDDRERTMLQEFFSEFVPVLDERTIVSPIMIADNSITGLCSVCPDISFTGKKFCFTGASTRYKRNELEAIVERLGGVVVGSLSAAVSYLIIGAEGNPCWAYACYGRKVEKAVALRKAGAKLILVHENDFHDAVADWR